ncbi:MAG TPA: type 1 glutamine amidotransferase domain-containing protein [Elusimicrobiota bacterium]|nr:type 1 glutamine amidotransferase domain-containing protein [Elusimicrobiota bacterium]
MTLKNKRIAVLVEKDYQDLEVWFPALRLREEGAEVKFLGTTADEYKGKYGYPLTADGRVEGAAVKDFDAVLVPGGWAPDFLRRHESVLRFVRDMDKAGKVVGAICHAGWVLASAGILKGRTVTAFSAIQDDVRNAGANYVDREVVVDRNLVTSRNPDDLPAFCREIIALLNK